MYEQDIELAKLLLERLTELNERTQRLHSDLDSTRAELARIANVRDERAQYMDILARAARLLERPDLEVESPRSDELEQQEADLLGQIDEINREGQVYRELIGELSQRAPQLVQAAGGASASPAEPPAADADAPAAESEAPEASEDAASLAVEAESAIAAGMATEQTDSAPFDSGMSEANDPALILGRFNISNLKAKESFTFGRGAAYLIDAASVLDRVPFYDRQARAMRENDTRDELLRDIDTLSSELTGEFRVVFSSWYQPALSVGNRVTIEYATGKDEGTKAAGDALLHDLVGKLSSSERSICIVTGDNTLADELRGPGVHIISLGEFFRT